MNKRNRLNLSLPPTGNEVQRQEEPAENEPVLDDQLERLTLTLPQPQVERIPEWILQKQRVSIGVSKALGVRQSDPTSVLRQLSG